MSIIKKISSILSVLLVICLLIPCVFALEYDIGSADIAIINSDGNVSVNGTADNSDIVIYGGAEGNTHALTISSQDANGNPSDNNVSITIRDAYIGSIDSKYVYPVGDTQSVPTLDINVVGNNTIDGKDVKVGNTTIGKFGINVDCMDLDIHSDGSGVLNSSTVVQNKKNADSSITLQNVSINAEGSPVVYSCSSEVTKDVDVNINNCSIVSDGSNAVAVSPNHTQDNLSAKTTLNINSSKIDTSNSLQGITCWGANSEINISNSDINIKTSAGKPALVGDMGELGEEGILTIATLSASININSSNISVATENSPAVIALSSATGSKTGDGKSSITITNSSIESPNQGYVFTGQYLIEVKDEVPTNANAAYIAGSDGKPAKEVKIVAVQNDQAQYSITDLDGKTVKYTETREGNKLILTADAEDIIFTLTPLQARQLLASGVEIIAVKTNSHEYTLDLVKIVEALETNEANIVLKTKGQDIELLIGKEDCSRFVSVK